MLSRRGIDTSVPSVVYWLLATAVQLLTVLVCFCLTSGISHDTLSAIFVITVSLELGYGKPCYLNPPLEPQDPFINGAETVVPSWQLLLFV